MSTVAELRDDADRLRAEALAIVAGPDWDLNDPPKAYWGVVDRLWVTHTRYAKAVGDLPADYPEDEHHWTAS